MEPSRIISGRRSALELASLDSIPENLLDNAAILGCLSLLVAALFIVDAARKSSGLKVSGSQTEPASGYARFDDVTDGVAQFTKFGSIRDESMQEKEKTNLQREYQEQQLETQQQQHPSQYQPHMVAVLPREPAPQRLEQVTSVILPTKQSPVFSRVTSGDRAVITRQGDCHESEITPTSPGFVQQAARQWERAAKTKSKMPGTITQC
ncbi:uncharacterized protein LOC113375080 [Ctenocephalides felis]|uniref:uncharacterized protein LOC113375080 n=1 Tax=Ctenocephalides felis TaxID=7515 RepID=UPI000E6E42E0|nr:uncharacterized protein LOC113375080 [Ctenocephalides felis]